MAKQDIPEAAPTKEEFLAVQDELLDIASDESDAAFSRRGQLKAKMRKWGPHAACGDEPMQEITVPLAHDGITKFQINRKVYFGKCYVPACVVRELAGMIDRNRTIDRDRFRDQIKNLPGVEISAKATG